MKAMDNDSSIIEVSSAQNVPGYTAGKMLFYIGDTAEQNIQTLNYYGIGYNYFELLKSFFSKRKLFF